MKVNIGPSYDTLDNGIYIFEQRNEEDAVLFMNLDTYKYLIHGIDYMSNMTDSSFMINDGFDAGDKRGVSGIYKGKKIYLNQDLNFGEIDVR